MYEFHGLLFPTNFFLGFIGPINLVDDPIPDVMIKVREKKDTPPPDPGMYSKKKYVNNQLFVYIFLFQIQINAKTSKKLIGMLLLHLGCLHLLKILISENI